MTVFLRNTQRSDDGLGGEDRFDNVENVFGSNFDDQLTGDIVGNVNRGRGGDNTISGGAGYDTANGGRGSDICSVEVPSSC